MFAELAPAVFFLPATALPGGALDVDVVGTAGLYAAQSMLTVLFAAVALEAAFGAGVLRRMPGSEGQVSSQARQP